MGDIQKTPADTVARRLQTLAQLYQQGQASALMDRTLKKLLSHEANACRAQLDQLQIDLAKFEQQYTLSCKRETDYRSQSGHCSWYLLHDKGTYRF